ncbi:MAG: hypothetical protein NXI32_26480 [bacterium]|nr:hypothetical protein [bacterium]
MRARLVLSLLVVWLADSLLAQEVPHVTQTLSEPSLTLAAWEQAPISSQSPPANRHAPGCQYFHSEDDPFEWLQDSKVGYDGGFVIASDRNYDLDTGDFPFQLKINGWGQLRHTIFDSDGPNRDLNQFQLKRARIVFSGSAFTKDFKYFVQLDGRSTSGDDIRLLDYYLNYDIGHRRLGLEPGTLGFLTGRYKVPFNLARWLSGREFEFTDRSLSSIYFDVNRSLASSIYGRADFLQRKIDWEATIFNGLVSGGAETGSSGTLDNNFAVSGRASSILLGEWGDGQLADFDYHEELAVRVGGGFALSEIDREGSTEFSSLRVVDAGIPLANLLPAEVSQYRASLMSVDSSWKYRGFSSTLEYYFRIIDDFQGAPVASLFDHGFWLQFGYFVIPERLQLLSRWSRVQGNSGTLGFEDQSAEEIAGGLAYYARRNHAKIVVDLTFLDGAPINSSVLDISAGSQGVLLRSQAQFSF